MPAELLQTDCGSNRSSMKKKKKTTGFFGTITKIFKKKEVTEVKRSSSEGKYKLTGGVLMTEPSNDSKDQQKKQFENGGSPKHHQRSRSDAISDADDLLA